MSNIVLDANDRTRLWDKSFFFIYLFFLPLMDMDQDEIVEGLELSKAAVLV